MGSARPGATISEVRFPQPSVLNLKPHFYPSDNARWESRRTFFAYPVQRICFQAGAKKTCSQHVYTTSPVRFPLLRIKRKTARNIKFLAVFLLMVEPVGIEPTSKDPSQQLSPSASNDLVLVILAVHWHTADQTSFLLPPGREAATSLVHCRLVSSKAAMEKGQRET